MRDFKKYLIAIVISLVAVVAICTLDFSIISSSIHRFSGSNSVYSDNRKKELYSYKDDDMEISVVELKGSKTDSQINAMLNSEEYSMITYESLRAYKTFWNYIADMLRNSDYNNSGQLTNMINAISNDKMSAIDKLRDIVMNKDKYLETKGMLERQFDIFVDSVNSYYESYYYAIDECSKEDVNFDDVNEYIDAIYADCLLATAIVEGSNSSELGDAFEEIESFAFLDYQEQEDE